MKNSVPTNKIDDPHYSLEDYRSDLALALMSREEEVMSALEKSLLKQDKN